MGKKKKGVPEDATPEEQVEHYMELSRECHAKGNLGSAVFQAEEATKLAKSALGHGVIKTAHAMINLAFLFIHQNKVGKARGLLEQARTVADDLNDPGISARAMDLLAECALQDKHGVRKTVRYKNAQQFQRLAEESREKQARGMQHPKHPREQPEEPQEPASARKRMRPESSPPRSPEGAGGDAVPVDLNHYDTVDGSSGWMRHKSRFEWLYHTESKVFYNTESTDYYRIENGRATLVQKEQHTEQKQEQQEHEHERAAAAEEAPPAQQQPEAAQVMVPGRRVTGTVKYVVPAKGYGFVVPDSGAPDLYFKPAAGFQAGQRVEFSTAPLDGKEAAVQLELIQEELPEQLEEPTEVVRSDTDGLYMSMGPACPWDKQLRAGDATLRGRQLHNEDRVTTRRSGQLGVLGSLFGLYDGHGGHACAEYCRVHLPAAIYKAYRDAVPSPAQSPCRGGYMGFRSAGTLDAAPESTALAIPSSDKQVEAAFHDGIATLDDAFLAEARAQELRCGSTAVQCLVHGQSVQEGLRLTVANVGDSRIVLCRGGRAVRLSDDHKPNRKDEKLRIERAGGTALQVGGTWRVTKGTGWGTSRFNIPESQLLLATSRSLGDLELKDEDDLANGPIVSTPEVSTRAIEEEDFLVVLGSDGVFDHLTDQEVVDIAMEHFGNPQQAAQHICQAAFDNESEDNITALVVEFKWNQSRVGESMARVQAEKESIKEKMKNVDMFADSDDD